MCEYCRRLVSVASRGDMGGLCVKYSGGRFNSGFMRRCGVSAVYASSGMRALLSSRNKFRYNSEYDTILLQKNGKRVA